MSGRTVDLTGCVLLGLGAACGLGPAGGAATVRDSAGITIVENTGTGWTVGEGWAVADTPTVDIGGDERDPRYDLGQVAGAVLLSDGRIAIANGATSEIRFYDPGGGHLSSAGRRGSGPGEYQALVALWLGAGDSVLTFDPFARRITVVPPDGGPPRTLSLGGESGMPIPTEGRMSLAVPTGRFADGTLLGVIQGFRFNDPREGRYRDTVAYVRYGPDGAVLDTVAQLPGLEMEQMTLSMMGQSFSTPTAVPLGRTTPIGIGGTRIAAAMNDRYEIELRDASGRLERLIRLDRPAAPITGEDQAGHRKEQLEQMEDQPGMSMVPGPMKAQMRTRVEQATYPETFPFLSELRFDQDGNLWAEEVQRPGTEVRVSAVFSPDGTLLGRVAFPPRFRPTWIGRDRVVGVWRDPDQVEHVRVYLLQRD